MLFKNCFVYKFVREFKRTARETFTLSESYNFISSPVMKGFEGVGRGMVITSVQHF